MTGVPEPRVRQELLSPRHVHELGIDLLSGKQIAELITHGDDLFRQDERVPLGRLMKACPLLW